MTELAQSIPEGVAEEILRSHAIDPKSALFLKDAKYTDFVESRQDYIQSLVVGFLRSRWEFEYENTRSLDLYVIDDLEEESDD